MELAESEEGRKAKDKGSREMRQGGAKKKERAEPVRHAPPRTCACPGLEANSRRALRLTAQHLGSCSALALTACERVGRWKCESAIMLGQLEQRQGC